MTGGVPTRDPDFQARGIALQHFGEVDDTSFHWGEVSASNALLGQILK
jgi:hypothetical protein